MSTHERERAELFELLVPNLGREATVRLVDTLPPAGEPLATAAQLSALEQRIDLRFDAVDLRFDGLRDELLAAFRGEIVSAVSGQTRAVITAVATVIFGLAGVAFALSKLV